MKLNLVVAHKTLGQYAQALNWVNSALRQRLRPFEHAKFLVNRGNIYCELGHKHQTQKDHTEAQVYYRKSETSYRQAIKIYPQNLKARINLASILGITGRLNEAIALYEEILAIDSSNPYVKNNLQQLQEIRQKIQ
jgi:tetratricopeptide (TPR) repeat protein